MKNHFLICVLGIASFLGFFSEHGVTPEALAAQNKPQLIWEYPAQQIVTQQIKTASGVKNMIYLVNQGTLRAIDALTGKIIWSQKSGIRPWILFQDNVIFASGTGGVNQHLIAYDSIKGKILWSTKTVRKVMQIMIQGRTVLAWDGMRLNTVDSKSGKMLWSTTFPETLPTDITLYAQISDVLILNAFTSGKVSGAYTYGVNIKNGRIIWKNQGNSLFSKENIVYVFINLDLQYIIGDFKISALKINAIDGRKISEEKIIVKEADPDLKSGQLSDALERHSSAWFQVIDSKLWVWIQAGYGSAIEKYSFLDSPIKFEARYEGLGREQLIWFTYGLENLVVRTRSGEVFGASSDKPLFVVENLNSNIQDIYSIDKILYFFARITL